ncbi:tyrosine-type recombinase/integrase [Glaciecola sp. SC05]|uniref:tyrosine-type recombinase/integrase n=1 Tax=Glaciecola sp. SC05 TaxID=1987355 RepID=UPI003526EE21
MDPKDKHNQLLAQIKSGKTSDAIIKALVKNGVQSFTSIERGLYLRISIEGSGFFVFQYQINGKKKRMTLGKYGRRPDGMPLTDARTAMAEARAIVNGGKDPLQQRKRAQLSDFKTVDDLAQDWLKEMAKHLKYPSIPNRIYTQEIKPKIGNLPIDDVTGLDIRAVLAFVKRRKKGDRPTIANDTLIYLKQLFDHGITLGINNNNPAAAFKTKHAGGVEKSRDRAPNVDEWRIIFQVMREHQVHFSRENYLAVAMLLVLGVRKGELISLRWDEIDFDKKIWYLGKEKAKNDYDLDIPLPPLVIEWLEELKMRAYASKYVFPSRRASKRRGYISDDTLNHALTNLFGKKTGKSASSTGNVLGKAGVEYFVVHDIRRSTRTIMSQNKVRPEVAEKAIGHVKKGVEGIYNRDAFFEERVEAHRIMAELVGAIV